MFVLVEQTFAEGQLHPGPCAGYVRAGLPVAGAPGDEHV